MDVFMLYHIYEQKDDFGVHDEEKLIGIFSSEANAQGAIEHLKDKDGSQNNSGGDPEILPYLLIVLLLPARWPSRKKRRSAFPHYEYQSHLFARICAIA